MTDLALQVAKGNQGGPGIGSACFEHTRFTSLWPPNSGHTMIHLGSYNDLFAHMHKIHVSCL